MLDAFLLTESVVEPFDKVAVEKLRKDTLQLMKAADKAKTYDDLLEIRKAVATYSEFVNEVFYKGVKTAVDASAEDMAKRGMVADKSKWSTYWTEKIGKETWGLYIALSYPGHLPIGIKDPSYQQGLVNEYLKVKDKWIDKVQREARKAWAVLKKFVDETESATGASPKIQANEVVREVIDGVRVQYEGRDINPLFVERFRAGMKIYVKKMKAVFPQAMRNHLPIIVTFVPGESTLSGPAAYYEHDHIRVIGVNFGDTEEMAHVVAHESGHHVYRAYLSGAAQDYWVAAVESGRQDLKLSEIVANWKDGQDSLYSLMRWLEGAKNAELASKLSMLVYHPTEVRIGGKEAMRLTKADAEEMLKKDGDQTFSLSIAEVTPYAQKNAEEAFCEAFSLYVAYGPGKIPAVVRHWLHVVLPDANIREEREGRLADLRELFEAAAGDGDDSGLTKKKAIKGKLQPSDAWRVGAMWNVDDEAPHGDGRPEQCANCGLTIKNCVEISNEEGEDFVVGADCADSLASGASKEAIEAFMKKESNAIKYARESIKWAQNLSVLWAQGKAQIFTPKLQEKGVSLQELAFQKDPDPALRGAVKYVRALLMFEKYRRDPGELKKALRERFNRSFTDPETSHMVVVEMPQVFHGVAIHEIDVMSTFKDEGKFDAAWKKVVSYIEKVYRDTAETRAALVKASVDWRKLIRGNRINIEMDRKTLFNMGLRPADMTSALWAMAYKDFIDNKGDILKAGVKKDFESGEVTPKELLGDKGFGTLYQYKQGVLEGVDVKPLKEEILGTTGQKLKDELGSMPGFKDMTDDFFWSELGDMFKKYKATAVVFAPGVVRALFDFLASVKLPITNAGTDEVKLKTERYDVARLLQILERAKILIPDMMPALEVLKGTVGKAEAEKLKNDPHKSVIGYVLHTHFKDRLGGVLRRGGFPMAGLTGLQESLGLTEGVERIETFADYTAALATIKRYREAAMGGRIQGKDTGHEKAADELQAQVNDYLRREKSKGAASRAAAGDDDYRELPYDQRVATMYFKKAAGERGREYYNRELDMLATALEGNKKVRFFLRDVSPAGGVLWVEIDGKESQISKKKVRLKDLNGMLNGDFNSPIVGR